LVWQYEAVFAGVVTDIVDPALTAYGYGRKHVMLNITEAFTGLEREAKQITIQTGLGGGDCGYTFERGTEYLIYAYRRRDRGLETGICSPTRPVADASEDLKYLRNLRVRAISGEVRITAVDVHKGSGRRTAHAGDFVRLSGAKVSIEGQNIRLSAETESNGSCVFGGLPPGEYKIGVALEGYSLNSPVPRVKLHAKGCAEVGLPLQLDRVVTGMVVTREGLPAAGVRIEAIPVHPRHANDLPSAADRDTTDANGRYELRHLQAGEYYLGTSLGHTPTKENPYTRWFYPGTEDPGAAVRVHIYDKPERQRFDLTLPHAQKRRVIAGVVIWPDGRPAADVQIMLEDPRWPWQVSNVSATTDSAGRFAVAALDGTKYRIHAVTFTEGGRSAELSRSNLARPTKFA
jgi:5-hydroxyisourate hydrolase-like protein (transthyretin family)